DNSIVIVENIERFMAMGYSRIAAAIRGTQQLMGPVISATLTTIFAFIPIALMPEKTGEFIKSLPIGVVATLLASLVIATTLTPLLASWLLKHPTNSKERKPGIVLRGARYLIEGPYRKIINLILDNRLITASLSILLFMGAVFLMTRTNISFFPKADKPLFKVQIHMPKGTNLDATDEVTRYVESVLDTIPMITHYATNVGHGNARIFYNLDSRNYRENFADIVAFTDSYFKGPFTQLISDLRETFDQYSYGNITVKELQQGPPSEGAIAISIIGDDLDQLGIYANRLEQTMEDHPAAFNVENPLKYKGTDLYFNINKEKALMLGVPIYSIDKSIRSYLSGNMISTFKNKNAKEFDIVVEYKAGQEFELSDFDKLSVRSMTGNFIPIKQFASIEFREAPVNIDHRDGRRTVLVSADKIENYSLDRAVDEIVTAFVGDGLQPGYSYELEGEIANRDDSFGGLGVASVIALLLILGVLVVQFSSFRQPLIIASSLPLAFIGSIVGLWICGYSFSFTGFIGLVSLIGISINNSIVLVDFANVLVQEGRTIREAIIKAAETRFLPIIMTTLTTILGLLPLTLSESPMWTPMGIVIIGGLISSTFFILLIVPVLYTWLTKEDRAERLEMEKALLEIEA
ncbi:MAG: efflux RND transporter permease subunit, partial [Bacteroidia bacterium]|nr:efflux RND transporter permease subunit [Bacteroidia bacterium]